MEGDTKTAAKAGNCKTAGGAEQNGYAKKSGEKPAHHQAAAAAGPKQHCVRCHEDFVLGSADKCKIDHDPDTFEGGRYGSEYYQGNMQCCGAERVFHRHGYGKDYVKPKYCFKGGHTTDPTDVEYNKHTIMPCTDASCGKMNAIRTQEQAMKQKEAAIAAERVRKEARKKGFEEREQALASQGDLSNKEKRREARYLRAERLGRADLLEDTEQMLNTSDDEEGCEEFDNASSGSIECPF
jgi:hypothetical protein